MSFEGPKNFYELPRKKELDTQEKERLVDLWGEVVLGKDNRPENIAAMKNADVKQWLYASLMQEIKTIDAEWGFVGNKEMIEESVRETDRGKKSALQLQYIFSCNEQFKKFREHANKDHDTRWDTMPLTMRENKAFNCVGASLVGHDMLNQCGIENFFGNPVGHIVNVARLDDGKFWYVDFRNDFIHPMDPEIMEINKVKTAKMRYPSNEYKHVALCDAIEIPSSILGNIVALTEEARSDASENDKGKEHAQEILQRFSAQLDAVAGDDFAGALYPEIESISGSHLMEDERGRVKRLRQHRNEFINEVLPLFSEPQWKEGLREIRNSREVAEKYLLYGETSQNLGNSADSILKVCREKVEELEKKHGEDFGESLEHIIALIVTTR